MRTKVLKTINSVLSSSITPVSDRIGQTEDIE